MTERDYSGLSQFELGEVQNARKPIRESDLESLEVKDREIPSLLELDLESLSKDHTYRWVRKHPLRIARAKAKGYEVVEAGDEEIKNIVGDDVGERADGTITVGDVMLMRCPKREVNARRKAVRTFNEKRLGSVKKQFKRMAKKAGVEVTTSTREE